MNSENKIENGRQIKKRLLNMTKDKICDYYNNLLSKDLPKKYKSNIKITDNNFVIPDISEYNLLMENSYSTEHLKKICRFYKQKLRSEEHHV